MAAAVTASTVPLGQQHHHLQPSKAHPNSTSPSQSRLQSHQELQSTGGGSLSETVDDNHSAHSSNITNGHVTNVGLPTFSRAPLTQPPHRLSSPGPNSKFAPASAVNGAASSMTTATSQSSGTFGGRSHVQSHQQHYQYQQHQHDLLLDDEKELQKKNAGPVIPGSGSISAFLPPALNQSLIKAVQSAKDVVNSPSSPHSKMSLPRLPIIAEGGVGGIGGNNSRSTTSAFAPRSSWRSQLNMNSIIETLRLPVICLLWYLSSAVTNNLGKQIMNQFRYPVTLTFVQFWFVSIFCFISSAVFNMARIRRPTSAIIKMTAPLVGFQVVGHVFSSVAISRVPLSVVHTVKALTPLFTVLFYRVVLGMTYGRAVYISLVPLTAGVMLACRMSLEFNNMVGLSCALLSTLVFVMQNVFTKEILSSSKTKQPQHGQDEIGMNGLGNRESISGGSDIGLGGNSASSPVPQKLDKINILFYSSTLAAVCMIPMWFYAEGASLMFSEDPLGIAAGTTTATWSGVSWLLFWNGVSHYFQNFLAFSVLALTSPVTYSVASLIKRIIVIIASIVYFHQTLGTTQWTGVCMTFWGLWLYNSAKNASKNAAKVNPGSGILATTKVGRRMSRGFGRGIVASELDNAGGSRNKSGFIV